MSPPVEDAIEKVIGRFGRYQTWILILIAISRLPTDFQLTNVVFIIPSVDYVCKDSEAYNLTNYCPCENPEYDQTAIEGSVTSEWNLICGKTSLASLAQAVMQIGIVPGSLIYGHVSDRYGRKLAVVLANSLAAVFGVISAVVPELWMFIVSRFLIGTSVGGSMLCTFILVMEISGKSFRPYLLGLHEISYVVGYFFLPIIAYYVRDWRHLQLVTSAPWLIVIATYWITPESPRWLITMGKTKEAVDILTYIAKKNNRPTDNIKGIVNEIVKESKIKEDQNPASYLDLFRSPKIRTYTIINAFVWMCCAHTFFGVGQYIGRLQGNLYVNVMLAAISHAPTLILVVLGTVYLNRRVSVVIGFTVAALSLFVFIIIPADLPYVTLTFAIIGQTGAYASFVLIYLYSSELFPTVIRNSALGFASVFARFGSFIAPFVVNIGVEWASILIFASLALFAAVLCCFLKETKDIVLLNTIEQTEHSENSDDSIKPSIHSSIKLKVCECDM